MTKKYSFIDGSKLQTFKSTALYGLMVFVFFVIINIVAHNNVIVASLNLFSAIVLLTVWYLIKLERVFGASLLFFMAMPGVLFVFDVVLGNVGASFYHFSFIVLASFLINRKPIYYAVTIYSTMCFGLFYGLDINPIYPEVGAELFKYNIVGSILCVIVIASVYKNESNKQILRITDQKNEIRKQQNVQELLLKELNHRIKNNLQQISSILKLEIVNSDGVEIKDALIKTRNRVYALSLIYKKLYSNTFEVKASIKQYLNELIQNICETYEYGYENFETQFNDVELEMQDCITIGLIINELITNSIKYSGQPNAELLICISISMADKQQISINFNDNGKGFSNQLNVAGNGLKLIKLLLTKNEGTVNLLNNNGARVEILYPISNAV